MDECSGKENVSNETASTNESDLAFVSLESDCSKRLDFGTETGLINQMNNHLSLSSSENGTAVNNTCRNGTADENDSGVDTGAALLAPVQLQRALSNNSAGYTSSSGGMDCQFASCNSSLLSVCSDSMEDKPTIVHSKVSNDCTSENGSESSSVSGDKHRQKPSSVKKRVALAEPKPVKSSGTGDTVRSRLRTISVNRERFSIGAPSLTTSERVRARSREKQLTPNGSSKRSPSSPNKKITKPNTLSLNGSDSAPKATIRRAVSMCRRTTPNGTPYTEDGRWPSIVHKPFAKVQRHESLVIKTKVGQLVLDSGKTQTPDRYTTLPRRKRANSEEDLSEWRSYRSTSSTRQDRMTASTIVRRPLTRESPNKSIHHPILARKPKTIIYHEALVQTALTSQDIDDAFAGHVKEIPITAVTKVNRDCQVDLRDKYIERLEEQIRSLTADNDSLKKNLKERSQLLASKEHQLKRERDEKTTVKQNTERFLDMLRSVNGVQTIESDANCDSLSMLESQIQLSGHAMEVKQCQIDKLREFCRKLQAEMSLSMQVQQTMLEERNNFEKETNELQDFLQDEKTAIVEALKEAETEIEQHKCAAEQKNKEIERLQDECRHLVRICEQRRQEFLGMQSKCDALKTGGMNLITQQNAASLTLSNLKLRLGDLANELTTIHNISIDVLENDHHKNGNGEKISTEFIPADRHQMLIKALVKAIDNATTTDSNEFEQSNQVFRNDGLKLAEMLDSETEPQLMMIENGLEDALGDENTTDSLHNLCEAITNRQKIEEMMNHNNHNESTGNNDDNNITMNDQPNSNLIENVLQVDRLITRLLKVLQIIQTENVNHIQQFVEEKKMSFHQTNTKTNGNEIMPKVAIDEDDKENYNGNDYEMTTTSNINGVIETLNGIQSIVKQCPALENLQRDLELMISNGNPNE